MPPRRRALPPLNALRAFEAFGRHGKMTTAADELFVTHGAVSRQIRQLEEWLGYPLTEGPKTQLRLTPQAQRLLGAATAAFDLVQDAAAPALPGERELRLACHGTFAIRWLIPRLNDFVERHPDVRLQVREISGDVDPGAMHDFDAAIQLVEGRLVQGQTAILDNWCGPVISPKRWAALAEDAQKLLAEPRLHARTWSLAWNDWSVGAGNPLPAGLVERSFDHLSHALEAAAAGLGVAMAPWTFVADDVAVGRLAAPLGFVKLPGKVSLVRLKSSSNPALDHFAAWLAEQGERMPAPPTL
jgi:LysR family transcriptional regulator, glycine cleavage system transcriptional activator